VAQTFVRAFEKAETYRGDSSLLTWLMRIATNLGIDTARRQATVPMLGVEDNAEVRFSWDNACSDDRPDHHAQNKQMSDCVRTQFELFRRRHPQPAWALWSRMCEETDLDELSALLGKSNGATRQYLSEWARKLREILAPCQPFLSNL
jgi:RNA polymerase sigma-70 factor (ECF subfamily)